MKSRSTYISATVWYVIANFLGQGTVLLSNIIFTRIMNQSDYGLYSTYYSIVSLLTPFVGCNLFLGLCNGYIDFKEDRKRFRASIFLLSIFLFLFFSIVFFAGTFIFNYFSETKITFFVVVFALFHAYSFFIVNYFNNYQNMENNYKVKSVFMALPNILQILLSVLLICSIRNNSYHERVVGSSGAVLLCALFCMICIFKGQHNLIDKKYYKYALRISVPSVLSSISYLVMQQSDHIMITTFCGAEFTAVYSLVYVIGNVLYGFLQATSGVWQSWCYRVLDSKKETGVYSIQKWYLFFYVIIAYGLLMVSPEIIKLLSPSTYWEFNYIPPFVFGSCLLVVNNLYATVGEFYKKAGKISMNVLISALVNVVTNMIFIKMIGAVAAAYTSCFAYLIMVLLNRYLCKKLNHNFYSDKYIILFVLAIVVGCILFFIVNNNIVFRYICFFGALLGMLAYLIKNKNTIISLIKGE